MINLTAKKNSL